MTETAKPLSDRLFMATIGSCTCLTKTNVIDFHDDQCHYRLFSEAFAVIDDKAANNSLAEVRRVMPMTIAGNDIKGVAPFEGPSQEIIDLAKKEIAEGEGWPFGPEFDPPVAGLVENKAVRQVRLRHRASDDHRNVSISRTLFVQMIMDITGEDIEESPEYQLWLRLFDNGWCAEDAITLMRDRERRQGSLSKAAVGAAGAATVASTSAQASTASSASSGALGDVLEAGADILSAAADFAVADAAMEIAGGILGAIGEILGGLFD